MTPNDLVLTPLHLRFRGRRLPCSLGRAGTSRVKAEGDGATPAGVHRLVGVLYRPERVRAPARWARPIRPGDLWSDDPQDPEYNHLVRAPHRFSHERLRRSDPLYDIVVLTDWNWPAAQKGKGSAIFIHAWRSARYPTAGCIALRRDHLLWVAERITPASRLIVDAAAPTR